MEEEYDCFNEANEHGQIVIDEFVLEGNHDNDDANPHGGEWAEQERIVVLCSGLNQDDDVKFESQQEYQQQHHVSTNSESTSVGSSVGEEYEYG